MQETLGNTQKSGRDWKCCNAVLAKKMSRRTSRRQGLGLEGANQLFEMAGVKGGGRSASASRNVPSGSA